MAEALTVKQIPGRAEYLWPDIGGCVTRIGGQDEVTGHKVVPEINVSRWGGEAWLRVNFPDEVKDEKESLADDKLSLTVGNNTHRFYPKAAEAGDASHDLEWEIELKERPPSNKFEFDIEFSPGLTFYPQPEVPIDDCEIPERVRGSYAVYFNKSGNQYKAGKFGHIYRPRLTDAKGKTIWADIYINTEKKTLTILCSGTWLNNASYPVVLDPTYGYTSAGGSWWDSDGDLMAARPSNVMPEDGTLTKVWVYAYAGGSTAYDLRLGAFNHDAAADEPSQLIDEGSSTVAVIGSAAAWYSLTMPDSEQLSSGDTYWAVASVENETGGCPIAHDFSPAGYRYCGLYGYNGGAPSMPAAWPGAHFTRDDRGMSLYLEYETGYGETVNGVSGPAKVNGVEAANIAAVNGVT